MYMQNDIAAAATPLFHIDPPRVDSAEHIAEIEQVIALATAAIPKAQMKKLGRLALAPARELHAWSYFAQIRSEPIGGSGLEFRFPMSARDTGRRDLAATAAELAQGAVLTARVAGKLKELTAITREIADAALKPAEGGIAEMRLVGIGITPGPCEGQIELTVDVEMLGDDLTAGIERVSEFTQGSGFDQLEERLKELAAKHVERRKLLARAKVAGAMGWIDDSAIRILDISGVGRANALGLLRQNLQLEFSFGGESGNDLTGGVHWDDGIVRGYVENRERGNTFRLEAEVLTIEASRLPASSIPSLLGRHVGEVIDIAYIPGNALIVGVEESGEWLYLRLVIGDTPIGRDASGAPGASHDRQEGPDAQS